MTTSKTLKSHIKCKKCKKGKKKGKKGAKTCKKRCENAQKGTKWENISPGEKYSPGKNFAGERFRHLPKISSLNPDEIFPDNVY